MDIRWSLDNIYKGFDDPELLKNWEEFPKEIEKLNNYAKESFASKDNAAQKLEKYIELKLEMGKYVKIYDYSQLVMSVDSTNEVAAKYSDIFEVENAKMSLANTLFTKFVGSLEPLEDYIKGSKLLEEHQFYLEENARASKHIVSEAEELLLAQMANTGSSAWEKQFELLTSTVVVDIDIEGQPKQVTLPAVRNLAYSENPETRKKAYYAELEAYKKIEKPIANSLNSIKGEAKTVVALRGYESVIDMTLENSRMDRDTLDAMWGAIEEYLPAYRKYLKRKAEMLGHKNGLPFYDLFAPIGKAEMVLNYEDSKKEIIKCFNDFNPRMGDFAKIAFDNNWIDVYPREGKVGGAFCHPVLAIEESRIMLNHGDNFDSLMTMAHELGHGYHDFCLKGETYLNSDYSMPIAETASTFCENLIMVSSLKNATKEQSLVILETYVSGLIQVTIDIYSRYLFEASVIDARANGPLSVDELKTLMTDAQKKAYGDGLDSEYLHPYMWTCKPHYYRVGTNFYNFPYAYGMLFAMGLYARYQKDGDSFLPKYDAIFKATGKMNLKDVALMADIDVSSKDFWKSSLEIGMGHINDFIKVSEEL